MLKPDPALTLQRGDRIVVSARRAAFVDAERAIGPEVDDPGLLSVPVATAAAVVTSREVHGKTPRRARMSIRMRAACISSRCAGAPN